MSELGYWWHEFCVNTVIALVVLTVVGAWFIGWIAVSDALLGRWWPGFVFGAVLGTMFLEAMSNR